MLTSAQMRRVIIALGGTAAAEAESLIPLLTTLLKEQADGVAAVETIRG